MFASEKITAVVNPALVALQNNQKEIIRRMFTVGYTKRSVESVADAINESEHTTWNLLVDAGFEFAYNGTESAKKYFRASN